MEKHKNTEVLLQASVVEVKVNVPAILYHTGLLVFLENRIDQAHPY